MLGLFLSTAALGFVFCASPGIVMAEGIRRGVARGFWPVFSLQLGSLIGDMTWAVLALIGLAFVVEYPVVRIILGVAGVGLLLYLAVSALISARRGDTPHTQVDASRSDFATGAALSLGNPFAIAFWIGIGNTALTEHVPHPELIHFAVFLGTILLIGILWSLILSALVVWGRQFINRTFFRVMNVICGLVLIYFALTLLWNTVNSLLA